MKLSYLTHGFPGHPLHPPLAAATIGTYTFATIAGLADAFGISGTSASQAWWLALFAGLIVTVPTALAGLADWLTITRGTPLWRTATSHVIAMLAATVLFLIAFATGHKEFHQGNVYGGPLILTLLGFGLLTVGGWLGRTIVFVYGMRVLNLVDVPALTAVTPGNPKKERSEGA